VIEFNFTLIITWINFLVLFLILRKILFLPFLEIQEKRKKHKEDSQNLVTGYLKQAEALEKQYQERLIQVQAETNAMINQARQTAFLEKKQKKIEVEAEIANQIEQTRVFMEKEIQKARNTLPQRSSVLASQIMTKFLSPAVEVSQEFSLLECPGSLVK